MSFKGKNILLGVCGSIAAYKTASLIRLLVKDEANVQIVMTKEATQFITPLTLSTLSKNPVLTDYYNSKTGEWNNHVQLALEADIILIAPASANTLAKFASGFCDNLLSACYLSAKCPVYLAPAMDLDMWKHPATLKNLELLKSYGNKIIPPGNGELASGLSGEGRLAEPEEIIAFLKKNSTLDLPLQGKKALVTAGPTYEAIDPVRFVGNYSSGKMGFAIAENLTKLGAHVTLVAGPTYLETPTLVDRVNVRSAKEMYEACNAAFPKADIVVMSAAVADYAPKDVAVQKIKKKEQNLTIELEKTIDILGALGEQKSTGQTLIGFALETNNELANAQEKLIRKNADFIILNSLQDQGAGFATDTNKITVIQKDGAVIRHELKSKDAVAKDICELIIKHQQNY